MVQVDPQGFTEDSTWVYFDGKIEDSQVHKWESTKMYMVSIVKTKNVDLASPINEGTSFF